MKNFSFLFCILVFYQNSAIKRGYDLYSPTVHQDYEKRQRIAALELNPPITFRKSVKRSYDNMLGCWYGYQDNSVENFFNKKLRQESIHREIIRSKFQYQEVPLLNYQMYFSCNNCTDIVPYEGYYNYMYDNPEIIFDYESDSGAMEIVEEESENSINDID